ncbi:MAG: thioredoxin family protein [Pseudomonadota bacterium]
MPSLTLDSDTRATVAAALAGEDWVVACLCAGWCTTCGAYRASFDALAQRHADKLFVWIDIEDQAEVVGELDVENFPTLLVQRRDTVAFFGTVLPDAGVAEHLLHAMSTQSGAELAALASSSAERRAWQRDCNLLQLLNASDAAR